MRKVLDHLLFPALLVASLALGWVLNRYGYSDLSNLKGFLVTYSAVWAFIVAVRLLEQLRPFEPAWTRRDGQLANDIALSLLSGSVILLVPLATWYATALTWAINKVPVLAALRIWPQTWPAVVAIPLGIVVYDLGFHLAHRWTHTVPFFWRFHAVHHAAPRLSAINYARVHPANSFVGMICGAPLPMLLGMPVEVATWYGILMTYSAVLVHANIDMRCGIFNYFLNTPELHRWHHSPVQRETDTNYGEVTAIWDHVFRTFHNPNRRPPRNVGVDFPVSSRLIDQLVQPLTRGGLRAGNYSIAHLPAGEAGPR